MAESISCYAALKPGAVLEKTEIRFPELQPAEVEVTVDYCGLCYSDLSMIRNEWQISQYPLVPGHEAVGVVTAVGGQVPPGRLGQRVGVGWYAGSCGACAYCLEGRQTLCARRQRTIAGHHGGFARKVRCHWMWAVPMPAAIPAAVAGPMCCAGATVYQAMQCGRLRPSHRVGVVGLGGLGHLAVQFLRAWGCHVTAFTTTPDKTEEMMRLGAHAVTDLRDAKAMAALKGTCDWILYASYASANASAWLDVLAPGGTLHFVGFVEEPLVVPMKALLAQKSITASSPGAPASMAEMLDFAARHDIRPVVEELPMSAVNEAIRRLSAGDVRYRFVLKNDL